jgi:TldD protein
MNLTQKYADRITEVMKAVGQKADYWDVRFGEGEGTSIMYRSRVLERLSFPKSHGGSVRILSRGGWGFVAFSDVGELAAAAKTALGFARLFSGTKTILAPVEPRQDRVVESAEKKDFLKINTGEKIRVLDHYRDCIWRKKTYIVQSSLHYSDSQETKLLISSEGSCIEQEVPRVRCQVNLTASERGVIQTRFETLTYKSFKDLLNKDDEVLGVCGIVNDLVAAPPAKGGEMPVVIDGIMGGLFAHEAFGHLSEADNVESDEQLGKIMVLGRKMGSNLVTIYDDPAAGSWGYYRYDDEGTPAQKVVLLDHGVLSGRLHGRVTAGKMGEEPNGHCRASSVKHRPLVRMGVTRIALGRSDFDQLISGIKNGYYCVNWFAGMTDHENFTFTAGYGYEISNGKLGRLVRDIKLKGNLFETLKNISGVGKESSEEESGHCGKMGQILSVGDAAPPMRIEKVTVMGV